MPYGQIIALLLGAFGGLGWTIKFMNSKFGQFNKSLADIQTKISEQVRTLDTKLQSQLKALHKELSTKVSDNLCYQRRCQCVPKTTFTEQSAKYALMLKDLEAKLPR